MELYNLKYNEPDKIDYLTVKRQINKIPKRKFFICCRCSKGAPSVIISSPVEKSKNQIKLNNDILWLTCPKKKKQISKIESDGIIKKIEEKLKDKQQYYELFLDAHSHYAFIKRKIIRQIYPEVQKYFLGKIDDFEKKAIAGLIDFKRVKCLHSHYCHYKLYKANPIGTIIEELLKEEKYSAECKNCLKKNNSL